MAVMNTMLTSSGRRFSAEQVAIFTAEQRRLKKAAAGRRAAVAAAMPTLSSAAVRRSEHLR